MGISSALGVAPAIALVVALGAGSPIRADVPPDPKDLVKAELVAEKHVGRSGLDAMGRSASRDQTRLACLLAESRRFRPADNDRMEPAVGVLGRPYFVASAGALRARRNWQFRLCRLRRSSRPDQCGERSHRRRHRGSVGRGLLARLRRDLHTRRRQPVAEPACRRRTGCPDPAAAALFAEARRQLTTPSGVRNPLCFRCR